MKAWLSRSVLILILCAGALFAGISQAAVIQSQYDTSGWSYRIQGGFGAWWDPAGPHDSAEIDSILDILAETQDEGLNDFGMQNPPNIQDGVPDNT